MQAVLEQTALYAGRVCSPQGYYHHLAKAPGLMDLRCQAGKRGFAEVICAIAESEQAYVLAEADVMNNVKVCCGSCQKAEKLSGKFPGEIYTNGVR